MTPTGGAPGAGHGALSWEVDLDEPTGAATTAGAAARGGEVLGALPVPAASGGRPRRLVVAGAWGLAAVVGGCALLAAGRPGLLPGLLPGASPTRATASPPAGDPASPSPTATDGTGADAGPEGSEAIRVTGSEALVRPRTVDVATLRRGVAFTGSQDETWSLPPGPQGELQWSFEQTAQLVDDPDVPAAGGARAESRTRFRLSSSSVRPGGTLRVEEHTETHLPAADYLPGGKARCTFLTGDDGAQWAHGYDAFPGQPEDYPLVIAFRRRIALYPAAATGGEGRPVTTVVSGTAQVQAPRFDIERAPCFRVGHVTATYSVTVPVGVRPGRYRLALSSPARRLTGISRTGATYVYRTGSQIKARVDADLPALVVAR